MQAEEKLLRNYLRDLDKYVFGGGDCPLISVKILLPILNDDKNMEQWLILNSSIRTQSQYEEFEEAFLGRDSEERLVADTTLADIRYGQHVMYHTIDSDCVNNLFGLKEARYDILPSTKHFEIPARAWRNDPIAQQQEKEQTHADEKWDHWKRVIRSKFPFCAKSTLWTYVVLKGETFKSYRDSSDQAGTDIICSAFIIFSADVDSDFPRDNNSLKTSALIDKITQDYLYAIVTDKHNRETIKHAVRAAISQVMARNMSHNIGSHVLSKLIDALQIRSLFSLPEKRRAELAGSITNPSEDDRQYQYRSPNPGFYQETEHKHYQHLINQVKSNDNKKNAFARLFNAFAKFVLKLGDSTSTISDADIDELHELLDELLLLFADSSKPAREKAAYFNSYLKTRMDFLADIATGTATLENAKQFYHEVITGLDKNRILLDRISGVDNFTFKIKVRDCTQKGADGSVVPKLWNGAMFPEASEEEEATSDILVSIPNDILGCHAFYIILENLIRNTAKHSVPDSSTGTKQPVLFHIDLYECDDAPEFYKVEIYDSPPMRAGFLKHKSLNGTSIVEQWTPKSGTDTKHWSEKEKTLLRQQDYFGLQYLVEEQPGLLDKAYDSFWGAVTNPREKRFTLAKLLVYQQKLRINQPILNKENRIRDGALGLIEMEVSAAYLRKEPIEDVDEDRYVLPLDVTDIPGSLQKARKEEAGKPTMPFLVPFEKPSDQATEKTFLGYRFYLMKPKEIMLVVDKIEDWRELEKDLLKQGVWLISDSELCKNLDGSKSDYNIPHELIVDTTEIPSCFSKDKKFSRLPTRRLEDTAVTGQLLERFKSCADHRERTTCIQGFKDEIWTAWLDSIQSIKVAINVEKNSEPSLKFEGVSRDDSRIKATFTDHGEKWSGPYGEWRNGKTGYLDIANNTNGWWPILEGAADRIADVPNSVPHLKAGILLRRAIHDQVAIFDERIQSAATTSFYHPLRGNAIPLYELYACTGVFVPEILNHTLLQDSFDKEHADRLIECMKDAIAGKKVRFGGSEPVECCFPRVRYLVIHLGIIEKILLGRNGPKPPTIEKEIEVIFALLDEILQNSGQVKLIISTGRGVPGNLPSNIAFVNYSALSQYCIEMRNKFLLVNLLQSARVKK